MSDMPTSARAILHHTDQGTKHFDGECIRDIRVKKLVAVSTPPHLFTRCGLQAFYFIQVTGTKHFGSKCITQPKSIQIQKSYLKRLLSSCFILFSHLPLLKIGTSTFRWTNENFPPRFERDSKMNGEYLKICKLTCTYSPHQPPSIGINVLEND